MNPKIKNLIEELIHECNESDVAITLGAIDPSVDEQLLYLVEHLLCKQLY